MVEPIYTHELYLPPYTLCWVCLYSRIFILEQYIAQSTVVTPVLILVDRANSSSTHVNFLHPGTTFLTGSNKYTWLQLNFAHVKECNWLILKLSHVKNIPGYNFKICRHLPLVEAKFECIFPHGPNSIVAVYVYLSWV